MKITKLTIATGDLEGTKRFYTEVLELPIIEAEAKKLSLQVGHTELIFIVSKTKSPFYHFAFSIPTNKVEEAHAYIAARTTILPFSEATTIANFSNWNAHAFYFHDNQGNICEFIAHHDLQNSTPETFASASIVGICEIGIPVPDVMETCKLFTEQYDVPYYVKGPRLQDFSVMGDEHGLFIVTKIGRGWLPTQQPAERHFTKVHFKMGQETAEFSID